MLSPFSFGEGAKLASHFVSTRKVRSIGQFTRPHFVNGRKWPHSLCPATLLLWPARDLGHVHLLPILLQKRSIL
jgi:hypothetical protein